MFKSDELQRMLLYNRAAGSALISTWRPKLTSFTRTAFTLGVLQVCILNYRKDGKPFWNQLCLAPVSDEFGVAYYLGIQTNVTGVVLAHRSQQFSTLQSPIPGPLLHYPSFVVYACHFDISQPILSSWSPRWKPSAGPHGGVHSFDGCPDVVENELKKAAELGSRIQRWHSDKLRGTFHCAESSISRHERLQLGQL